MLTDPENSTKDEVIEKFMDAKSQWAMTGQIEPEFEIPSEAQLKKTFQWDKNLLDRMLKYLIFRQKLYFFHRYVFRAVQL